MVAQIPPQLALVLALPLEDRVAIERKGELLLPVILSSPSLPPLSPSLVLRLVLGQLALRLPLEPRRIMRERGRRAAAVARGDADWTAAAEGAVEVEEAEAARRTEQPLPLLRMVAEPPPLIVV
jgi:hypothetical protein